jgi:hypothetical protein
MLDYTSNAITELETALQLTAQKKRARASTAKAKQQRPG